MAGITFRETMSGGFSLGWSDPEQGRQAGEAAGTTLTMHAAVVIRDVDEFIKDADHTGELSGSIDFGPIGSDVPAERGVFNLFRPDDEPGTKLMVYELAFEWGGKPHYLAGRKIVRDDAGVDLLSDTTTLLTRLHEGTGASGPVVGAGVLSLGADDLVRLLSTVRVTDARSPAEQAESLAAFGRFFAGELWERYGVRPSWWRRVLRRLLRHG
jgi:cholesterol oxidase